MENQLFPNTRGIKEEHRLARQHARRVRRSFSFAKEKRLDFRTTRLLTGRQPLRGLVALGHEQGAG